MTRYYKQVRRLDRKGADIMEVVRTLCPEDPDDWARILVAGRLYVEDGGKRYTYTDFVNAAMNAANPTPPEVRGYEGEW